MTHFKAFSNIAVVRHSEKQNALFSDHVPKRTCSHPCFTQNALQQCIPFLFPELYTITVKCFNCWNLRLPLSNFLFIMFILQAFQTKHCISILLKSLSPSGSSSLHSLTFWLTSIFSMESLCLQWLTSWQISCPQKFYFLLLVPTPIILG